MAHTRVRFAPSPTGPLHIGGLRTALYNFLFARQTGGTFILRIEDTDQTRYVPGAEEYILESLAWAGIQPDEGPHAGGDYAPYRQSERQHIYRKYAEQLIASGHAYYAFDTPEELEARRKQAQEQGNHNFKYDSSVRLEMRNSLTLPAEEVAQLIESGAPYVVRLKVPRGEMITFRDRIRGEVQFHSDELDDKVLLKSDGMPTYHLANVVDDYLMKITHVIRGEEWLPSTGHHVLLYRAFGWTKQMPEFAHLPLILKPNGKGKLSKRDGIKLGIPVFPLAWKGDTPDDSFDGFREFGFLPEAVVNFLAFLGWNPGTEQEVFTLDELCQAFSLDKVSKGGARFDFDKARWFNQQHILRMDSRELARRVRPWIEKHGPRPDEDYLVAFCELMKERVTLLPDFWTEGYYFFVPVRQYDEAAIKKRWQPGRRPAMEGLIAALENLSDWAADAIGQAIKQYLADHNLKFGDVLPFVRLALAGTMKGPGVNEMIALLGKETTLQRLREGLDLFDRLVTANVESAD